MRHHSPRDDWEIREVESDRAEAVLTLRVFVPGAVEGLEEQYHLARVRPPKPVVTSWRKNPDGSATGTVTLNIEGGPVAYVAIGRGVTADGRGCGSFKEVSIEGLGADTVAVTVSMSWRNWPAGSGGFGERELMVPWLGATRQELPGSGWLAAEIAAVAETPPGT